MFINLKVKRDDGGRIAQPAVETTTKDNEPRYDYGTRITFGKETLEKLGLDISKFNVGDKLDASIKLEVFTVRDSKDQGYDEQSLELQITDIDMGGVKETPAAKKIADYKKVRDEYPTQEG